MRAGALKKLLEAPLTGPHKRTLKKLLGPGLRSEPAMVDLSAMRPQERLGALCRAAEKIGVMK